MIEPAKMDPARVPHIRWNKKQYPIPVLMPEQAWEIWEDVIRINTLLLKQEAPSKQATPLSAATGIKKSLYSLKNSDIKAAHRAIFYGLIGAHPDLTWAEFSTVGMQPPDVLSAFLVVTKQSQIFGEVDDGEPLGEATAAAA